MVCLHLWMVASEGAGSGLILCSISEEWVVFVGCFIIQTVDNPGALKGVDIFLSRGAISCNLRIKS